MAEAAKVLTAVDNQFIKNLNEDVLYCGWMDLTTGKQTKSKCLLLIISKNKIYFVNKSMFNGRKIQSEEVICRLTSFTVRGLNQNYMIMLESKIIGAVNLLPPDELMCEHLTLLLLGCLQRFRSCTVVDVKTKEDIPEDFRGKFEVALPTNVEICTFAYKFFCADRGMDFEPQVVSNISRMFKTDSTVFNLNRAIAGAAVQPSHFDHIIGALGKVKCFDTLEVDGLNMSNNTHIVGWLFSKNTSFKNLVLMSCRIGKTSLKSLLEPMKNLSINVLNLGYNPIRDAGIVNNKQNLLRICVKELHLNHCEFKDSGMDTLGMIFQGAKWNRRDPVGLTRLNLAGNKFGKKGVANLEDFLGEAVCLRELSLMKCDTDLTPILTAISDNEDLAKNFQRLNLYNNRLKPDSAKALGKLLTKVEALRFLNLAECNLNADLLNPIIVALSKNEIVEVDLNLSKNNLQGVLAPMMEKLQEDWQSCLSSLVVEDCELSVEDMKTICEVLCEKNKYIKLISFDLNFKTNKKNLNMPATGAIGKLITQTELEVLSLTGDKPNRKRSLRGGELRPIFDALNEKNKLTNLYIQGNRIGMEGLHYLKASLAKNKTLQVIDLENNKIDQEMAFEILELAKPGPLTSLLPMQALNRLKGEMNAKTKMKLKEKFSVARGILKENQQNLAKARHQRGVDIKGSNRTSILKNAKLVNLSLSHDVKNDKLSSKLFSDSDLATFAGAKVGEHDGDLIRLKSTREHTVFVVKREANVKDSAGKVKGQLQAGAKVTGELSTRKRIMKKSIKTSAVDIYEIHLIKPVDGWIQFHTYKGHIILEEVEMTDSAVDLFDDGFFSFSAIGPPNGLEVEGSSLVVRELVPGSQVAENCEIGDILIKLEDDDVTDPTAAFEAFKESTWPMRLTFSRPNESLNARSSVVMKPKSPNEKGKKILPARQGSLLGKKPKAPPKREAGTQTEIDTGSDEETDAKRDPSIYVKEDQVLPAEANKDAEKKVDEKKEAVVAAAAVAVAAIASEKKKEAEKEPEKEELIKEKEAAKEPEKEKEAAKESGKEKEAEEKKEPVKEVEKPKEPTKEPEKEASNGDKLVEQKKEESSKKSEDATKKEEPKTDKASKDDKASEPEKEKPAEKGEDVVKKEEKKEKPAAKKKVGGGLAARMALLNKAKGAENLAKGGKGAPKKRKKVGGKIGALAAGMSGIPMPGMGGHPGLKKKAKLEASKPKAPQSPVNLEKATVSGKRKRRKKKPKLGLDGL